MQDLPDGEAQFYYYKDNAGTQNFTNQANINYNWQERPSGPNTKTNQIVVAGAQALDGTSMLTNGKTGVININGYAGLDNVGLLIDNISESAESQSPHIATAINNGKINVTNGTAIKVIGNDSEIADGDNSIYLGQNASSGTITVVLDDSRTNTAEPELGAAGLRFTGPTTAPVGNNVTRSLSNMGKITVRANTGTNKNVYAAGMVVDGGADNVQVTNNGTIIANAGNYAIITGTDSAEGVTDLTSGTRVTLGKQSQIIGEVKLNHQTDLTINNHTEQFVLNTYSEQLKDADGSLNPAGSGIGLELTDAKFALQSGSDATISRFSDTDSQSGSTLTVNQGSYLTFTADQDAAGGNTPIEISHTTINNNGDIIINGGQSVTTGKEFRNNAHTTVTEGSSLTVSGARLFNYAKDSSAVFKVDSGSKVNVVDGTFSNYSRFELNDNSGLNVSGGTFEFAGSSELTADSSTIKVDGIAQFKHAGTTNIKNGSQFNVSTAGNLDALVGGSLNFDNSSGSISADSIANNGAITLKNGSELTLNSATGTAETPVSTALQNKSQLNVDHSTLTVNGRFVNTSDMSADNSGNIVFKQQSSDGSNNMGTITVNNGASFTINGGSFSNAPNNTINPDGGKVLVSGGKFAVKDAGKFDNAGTVSITGGTVDINLIKTDDLQPGLFNHRSGASLNFDQGTTGSVNALNFQNGGTINISGGSNISFNNSTATDPALPWEGTAASQFRNASAFTVGADSTAHIAHNTFTNDTSGNLSVSDSGIINITADKFTNNGTIAFNKDSTGNVTIKTSAHNNNAITIAGGHFDVKAWQPADGGTGTGNAVFTNSETGNITVSDAGQAEFDLATTNKGTISATGNSTLKFNGSSFTNSGSGSIKITDGSRAEITSDSFTNQGTITVDSGTLAFTTKSLSGATTSADGSTVSATLDALGTVTATNSNLELMAIMPDEADADATPQISNLNLKSTADLTAMGSGNHIKLNNNTAVTITEDKELSGDYFGIFTADAANSDDIATRNIYLEAEDVTFKADSSNQLKGAQNATAVFKSLTIGTDTSSAGSSTATLTGNITISNALSAQEGTFNTLSAGNDTLLVFDQNRINPATVTADTTADGSTPGKIGLNLTLDGDNSHLLFAAGKAGSTNNWEVAADKRITVNNGLMEIDQNATVTTNLDIAANGVLYTQYGSTLNLHSDNDSGTTSLSNAGLVVNHGTIDLGHGEDTIGLHFDEDTDSYASSLQQGFTGGGHIKLDLSTTDHGMDDWGNLNDLSQYLSSGLGNVEITGVSTLGLPTYTDENGYEHACKDELDEILAQFPESNIFFETEQTQNTVLDGLDDADDKLNGGGWLGAVAKEGVDTIGTTDGSTTNLYGDTNPNTKYIAATSDGGLASLHLGSGSTVNILGQGTIGRIWGEGTIKVSGENGGGVLNIKDSADPTADADLEINKLLAVSRAKLTARNITTQDQSEINGSEVTASGQLSLGTNARITQATLQAEDIVFGNNSNLHTSQVTAHGAVTFDGTSTITVTTIKSGTMNLGSLASSRAVRKAAVQAAARAAAEGRLNQAQEGAATIADVSILNSTVTADTLNVFSGSTLNIGQAQDASASASIPGTESFINALRQGSTPTDATAGQAYTGTVDTALLLSDDGSKINLNSAFGLKASILNAAALQDNILEGSVFVGQNSVFSVGFDTEQDMRELLQKEKLSDSSHSLSSGNGAVMALNQAIKIAPTARITINGEPTGADADTGVPNSLNLKNHGTLLLTPEAFGNDSSQSAITFTGNTSGQVTSDQGQIYLAGDFNGDTKYSLFDNGDLSGADDLTITSANGKIEGKLDANGDFILDFTSDGGDSDGPDSGSGSGDGSGDGDGSGSGSGSGGDKNTFKRIYLHASVPVDKMLQDVFNSKMKGTGSTFLRTVATTGMGDGIEAERAARLGNYAGATHAVLATSDVINSAVTDRMDLTYSTGNSRRGNLKGNTVWMTPLYQRQSADGFEAEGVSYGADVDVTGALLGFEHAVSRRMKTGIALGIGTGSADGSGTGAGLSTDFDWFGASLYTGVQIENFKAGADLSYAEVSSDFEGDSGLADYGKLSSSTKDKILSAGINASWRFNQGDIEIVPHAGLRYTAYDFDSYQVKSKQGELAAIEQDKMNVFSIPVGVGISRTFTNKDWIITPHADLTVTANLGDTDLNMTSKFNEYSVNLQSEVLDDFTYGAAVGVEITNGNFSFGAKVRYTGSSNADRRLPAACPSSPQGPLAGLADLYHRPHPPCGSGAVHSLLSQLYSTYAKLT